MRSWALWFVLAVVGCGGHEAPPLPAAASSPTQRPTADKEDLAPEAATGRRDGLVATVGDKSMVGAANPHAARAGREMLRAGGSAVDAAIAMALVLTLVEPQSSGIGGGAFMLHYHAATEEVAAYDGRETAPRAATPDMFLEGGKPRAFYDAVIGGLSVGVPGELRMFEMAHAAHGKLPWKRLFEPAIALAEKGFEVSPRLFELVKLDAHLSQLAATKRYFFGADGQPKPVGTVIRNPELAAVLRAVAEQGADAFYQGPIAGDIVAAVKGAERNPGRLVQKDLATYRAKLRQAVCRPYRSYRVCGVPPPSSGGVTTLQILGLLERFDMAKHPPGSVSHVHLFAEASKLAYADRDQLIADPDFANVPVEALLAPSYLAERSATIDLERAMPKATPGPLAAAQRVGADASLERPATSHMVAVDPSGNAVSLTASIEGAFGSHVMVRGFLLNNELTDFSFVPTVNGKPVQNRVQPGKRPRSSMAPTIVLDADGELVMALGSPGGSRIIGYVARVLLAVLDGGQDLQTAIAAPNFVNRNGPIELEADEGLGDFAAGIKPKLEALGHEVKPMPLNSGLHAIMRTADGLVGGADPRREGMILAD